MSTELEKLADKLKKRSPHNILSIGTILLTLAFIKKYDVIEIGQMVGK